MFTAALNSSKVIKVQKISYRGKTVAPFCNCFWKSILGIEGRKLFPTEIGSPKLLIFSMRFVLCGHDGDLITKLSNNSF